TYDAPSGIYKNHALAGQLLTVAARQWKFVPFTKKIKDFSGGMGQTITLVHYKALADPSSSRLEEETRIPVDPMTMGTSSITIFEHGRAVEFTSLAQQLGKFDPGQAAQKVLIDQMKQSMDVEAASCFTGMDAKVIFIPTSLTGGTWDTDGTPSTAAVVNVTKHHLGIIRDYMAKDLHVPFYQGEHYAGLFSTKALRGLKEDRVIEVWNLYLRKGDLIWNGEIGQVESIRLIEVNNESALSSSVGTGNVLGEALVIGDEAVGRIEIESPHLRAQPNYQSDFGRRHAVAWYGMIGFGVIWPTATDREAKIVRIGSQ
ncbi:MAG: hypothetical protein KKB20_11465, partial [Proteobacteria bacterium]|nr:hypothetical protein [Pseudomonadota bacterium]